MEYKIISTGANGDSIMVTVEFAFTEDFKIVTIINIDEFMQKINDFNNTNII